MHQHYIFSLILGWMAIFHPFYISLTEARYNDDSKKFEISQKLFWDDLETVLSHEYDKKVNFLRPDNQKELDIMLEQYLLKHNVFYVNGNPIEMKYIGYEIEDEAAWFYFQTRKVSAPKEVGMKNTVFLKHFDTQQHVVNLYLDKTPKTLMLDRRKEFDSIKFR